MLIMTTFVIILANIWNPRRVLTCQRWIMMLMMPMIQWLTSSLTWWRSLWIPRRMSSWIMTVASSSRDISDSPWDIFISRAGGTSSLVMSILTGSFSPSKVTSGLSFSLGSQMSSKLNNMLWRQVHTILYKQLTLCLLPPSWQCHIWMLRSSGASH